MDADCFELGFALLSPMTHEKRRDGTPVETPSTSLGYVSGLIRLGGGMPMGVSVDSREKATLFPTRATARNYARRIGRGYRVQMIAKPKPCARAEGR